MITPGRYDLTIYQGSTFSKSIQIRESDGLTPVNMTGYTARLQMRETFDSSTILVTLTTENGGISIDGATGSIVLTMSATATAALTWTAARYDLEIVSGATVYRPIEGKVKVSREVTR